MSDESNTIPNSDTDDQVVVPAAMNQGGKGAGTDLVSFGSEDSSPPYFTVSARQIGTYVLNINIARRNRELTNLAQNRLLSARTTTEE